jgi:RNA polymerase sigma-70 factor (ECF subfamily)
MPRQAPHGDPANPTSGQQGFELVYRNHAPRLRRRLRARLRSSEDANDLVQEAFARLLGSWQAQPLRNPAAFLNRTIRNLLIDRSRRAAARPAHLALDAGVDVAVEAVQHDVLEVEEMRERYRCLFAALPPRTREVFSLHRLDDLSYREIAERLDISIRTVEWHVAEAVARIGRGLDGQ